MGAQSFTPEVIDVLVSTRRDAAAAREFCSRALRLRPTQLDMASERSPVYPQVVDELEPTARHITE